MHGSGADYFYYALVARAVTISVLWRRLSNAWETDLAASPMRDLSVWVVELIKLLIGRRLHPLLTQCPMCQQTVHLHVNRAGRRHAFGHARGLYEGCRLCKHYVGRFKCLGSGALMLFDPRPNEPQRFKLPDSLLEK
jgi:hypothetical protein